MDHAASCQSRMACNPRCQRSWCHADHRRPCVAGRHQVAASTAHLIERSDSATHFLEDGLKVSSNKALRFRPHNLKSNRPPGLS